MYFLNSIQSPIISQKYLFIVASFILRFHSTNPLKKFRTIKITQLIKIATLIALLPPPSSGTKDKRGASVPLGGRISRRKEGRRERIWRNRARGSIFLFNTGPWLKRTVHVFDEPRTKGGSTLVTAVGYQGQLRSPRGGSRQAGQVDGGGVGRLARAEKRGTDLLAQIRIFFVARASEFARSGERNAAIRQTLKLFLIFNLKVDDPKR